MNIEYIIKYTDEDGNSEIIKVVPSLEDARAALEILSLVHHGMRYGDAVALEDGDFYDYEAVTSEKAAAPLPVSEPTQE